MDQPRTIERSRDDRVLFGVCGGIARAFDLDPTIVRVVSVVLVALGGLGLVAYIAAALLLPEEDGGRPIIELGIGQRDRTTTILGLLVLGALVVLLAGDPFPNLDEGGFVIGVAVIAAAWLLIRDRRRRDGEPARRNYDAAPLTADTAATAAPRAADTRPQATAPPTGDDATAETQVHAPAPEPRRQRASLAAWGLTLLAIAVGAAIVQAPSGDPDWAIFAAAAVIAVGAVLVLTAPFGGAPSLLACGFVLAGAVGVAAASDLSLDGGAGDRVYRPATVAELRETYELGAGSMTLDLSQLELPPGTTTVEADVGFGELLVDVPSDADVDAEGTANAGEVVLFGERNDGFDVDHALSSEGTGSSRLELDLHVGFGHIDVERGTR